MGILIYVQASLTGMCEAWIPKNDCRHFMHSIFFAKCFNVNLQNIKKGIVQALWRNHVHSQTFWKVHARSQSKFTKVWFKKIYCFKSAIHQKPLRAISGGSVCGKSVLATLLFTFKLLLLSVVFHCCKCKQTAPKAERQTTKFRSCHLLFAYARQFT